MSRESNISTFPTRPPSQPISGADLLASLRSATAWLAVHRDAVNDLNVFPVPDGDTGTNMLLTLRAAVAAGDQVPHQPLHAGPMAIAIAEGALIGARGNSGVILCQMIRGFALAIADHETIMGRDLAPALATARDHAYAAVLEPVEGTMLTVLSAAATGAAAIVTAEPTGTPDAATVLDGALSGARRALAETPDLLEVLRAANVVDAGGQGVVYLLEGLARYAAGEPTALTPAGAQEREPGRAPDRAAIRAAAGGDAVTGYCVNFLIWTTPTPDLAALRTELGALGTSVDLIAADHAVRVHLHTERPGAALEFGATLGELDRIEIDNMARQIEQARHAAGPCPAPDSASAADAAVVAPGDVGVLAVAPSAGLAAALRAMGAAQVIGDRAAVKPSPADFLAGLAAIPTDQIIILPNDPDVQMAAAQAATMSDKTVQVVPSRSVPQGLAALSALAPDRPLAENARRLAAAMALPRTIAVTRASRDATINAIALRAGVAIGFVDETLVATGDDLVPVTMTALAQAGLAAAELATIFTGADLDDVTAEALRAAIATRAPQVTVEIVAGGQPHYPILVGLE